MRLRWRAPSAAAILAVAMASGRQVLSPTISKTILRRDMDSKPPLVVLRAAIPNADGSLDISELSIPAQDPTWASQVEKFLLATGEDGQGVEDALNRVREASWAAGRSLRARHVVLLASAEDAQHDGDGRGSCTLAMAVSAASRHTTDAHFVLVANGFELGAMTREILEGLLDGAGWRSFTVIEVPEFEGFSSAFNRAMKAVSGDSVVAVLSTSAMLLPATLPSNAENLAGKINDRVDSNETSSDIFVAYERMQSRVTALDSAIAIDKMDEGASDFHKHDSMENAGAHEMGYDRYGRIRPQHNLDSRSEGLLVTASPSRLFAHGRRCDDVARSSKKSDGEGMATTDGGSGEDSTIENSAKGRQPFETDPLPAPAEARQLMATGLRNLAPLPLLVFDIGTFLALGELDEGFAFQGGIADWISRAKFACSGDDDDFSVEVAACCSCDVSSRRRRKSTRSECTAEDYGHHATAACNDGNVRHVHARDWGRQFVGQWPDDKLCQTRNSAVAMPDGNRPSGSRFCDGGGQGGTDEDEALACEGTDRDRWGQPGDIEDEQATTEIIIDPWTRLLPAKLEALIQTDADLFFLPFLLLQLSSESALRKKSDPMGPCIAFHSEWMARAPDKMLMDKALVRRNQFPVAAVVVVHDDIALMPATLEEAAAVVEHILVVVSLVPWNGEGKGVARTLEVLSAMLEDRDSPTYGKLRVEVGSWASEAEQREHGNAIIRKDPRSFHWVVVMDTDEFWHPVELTKALALMLEFPEAAFVRTGIDTYWASTRSVVFPPETFKTVWLMNPDRCKWYQNREPQCPAVQPDGQRLLEFEMDRSIAVLHHLSYVRVEEDLKRKVSTFSHAVELQSGWYERSWLGWAANNSLTDLHPTQPEAYKRVKVQPLLRLTPALRSLYLDAKKGMHALPSSASTIGSRIVDVGLESISDVCEPHPEASQVDGNETVPLSGSLRTQIYPGCNKQQSLCAGSDESGSLIHMHRSGAGGGCEDKPASHWTELQRMLCLIPDVEG